MNIYIIYFIGLLISANISYIWFNTTIAEKILSIFIKTNIKYPSYNDFISEIEKKSIFLSDLLSCHLCLSHWISLVIAIILNIKFNFDLFYILIFMFSWPILIHKIFFKKD